MVEQDGRHGPPPGKRPRLLKRGQRRTEEQRPMYSGATLGKLHGMM